MNSSPLPPPADGAYGILGIEFMISIYMVEPAVMVAND